MGMFRIATGLGGLLAPIFGAIMYSFGNYRAIFMLMGTGYFILSPYVYYRMISAKKMFLQAANNIETEEE